MADLDRAYAEFACSSSGYTSAEHRARQSIAPHFHRPQDDAATYLCIVLQHMIERLVAGALASCDKPELRTKYGGTGKAVHPGTDMQPRHFQDFIRTDKEMWSLFNSSFAFQVVLSVFLDHTTETVFQRLGLPIHNKGALAGCEYYATVINGLRQKKSNLVSFHHNTTSVDGSPPAPPSVITPAQLARVAAGVNPLCSMSPKASLMADALVHELCMAVCEGVVQSAPDTRVITMADLDRGIRNVFPEGLAIEATHAGRAATSAIWSEPEAPPGAGGEPGDGQVRLCVRRLQGTHTLLRKTFLASPDTFLFTVFRKACERLRIRDVTVFFVHDGMVLSGRQQAGTLTRAVAAVRPSVQIFAVCKRAWACKQRAAARRGLLTGNNSKPSQHGGSTPHIATDAQKHRGKAWQLLHPQSSRFAPKAKRVAPTGALAASGGLHISRSQPLLPTMPPSNRRLPSLPVAQEACRGGEDVMEGSESPPPRQMTRRRWIATPTEGTRPDLGRLEKASIPLPSRQLAGRSKTGVFRSGSTGLLVDSDGALVERDRVRGGETAIEGGGVFLSPRIERTMRRLSAMEECLRDLQDSMKELQSGELTGRPSGISSVAMAAITSQLGVAYNLSSLCRQVLPRTDDGVPPSKDSVHVNQENQANIWPGLSGTRASHHHATDHDRLRDGGSRDKRVSFLTEVSDDSQNAPGGEGIRSKASTKESTSLAVVGSDSPRDAAADRTLTGDEGQLQQMVENETSHRDREELRVRRREEARAIGSKRAGQQHNGAREQRTSSGSKHDHGRSAGYAESVEGNAFKEGCAIHNSDDAHDTEHLEADSSPLGRHGVERSLDKSAPNSAGDVLPESWSSAAASLGGHGGEENTPEGVTTIAVTFDVEDNPPPSWSSTACTKQGGDSDQAEQESARAATAAAAGPSTCDAHVGNLQSRTSLEIRGPPEARNALGAIGGMTSSIDEGAHARLVGGGVAQSQAEAAAEPLEELRQHIFATGSDVRVSGTPGVDGDEESGRIAALTSSPRHDSERVQAPNHSWWERERSEEGGQGGGSGRIASGETSVHAGATGGGERHGESEWDEQIRRKSASPHQILSISAEETVDLGRDNAETPMGQHRPTEQRRHGHGRETSNDFDRGKASSRGRTTDATDSDHSWSTSVATSIARQEDTALHHQPAPLDRVEGEAPTESAVAGGRGVDVVERKPHEWGYQAMNIERGVLPSLSSSGAEQDANSPSAEKPMATVQGLVAGERGDVRYATSNQAEIGSRFTTRPPGVLHPQPDIDSDFDPEPGPDSDPKLQSEPEPDRCGDEVWDDEGDEDIGGEDSGGNWSSWLSGGG